MVNEQQTFTEAEVEEAARYWLDKSSFGRRKDVVKHSLADSITGAARKGRDATRRVGSAAIGNITFAMFSDRRSGDQIELEIGESEPGSIDQLGYPATLRRMPEDSDEQFIDGFVLSDRISTRDDREGDVTAFRYNKEGVFVLIGLAAVAGTLFVAHKHRKE